MPTYEEAVELFERRKKAWLSQDLDAYLSCWAEDMTFRSPLHAEPLKGREAYGELIKMSAELVRPVDLEVTHIAAQGDVVLAEWRITIEWRSDGSRTTYPGMSWGTFRNGVIVDWREYWNPADVHPPT